MVFAQETRENEQGSSSLSDTLKYSLEPIVVTATRQERPIDRVPYAIDLIERKEIQRGEAGLSLDEVLRAVPGVAVNNRFNFSQGDQISIRGVGSRAPFGVRGIKIILDGIPLTMPDGQSQLNNLDLGSVGKIEVLRGPSSSLHGNAAGGLINIQTEPAPTIFFLLAPQFIAGADGLRKWQGKVSGKIGRHAYLVNVNKLELEGYREHSAANSASVNAVSRHDISKHLRLAAVFNYFDAPHLLNPSSLSKPDAVTSPASARFFVKQQGAGKQTRQGQGGITVQYDDGEFRQYEATFYGLSRSLLNPIPGRIIELDRISGGIRAVFSQRRQFDRTLLRWTLGTDFEVQDDARLEFENLGIPNDQVGRVEESSIFDLLQYGPRLLDQKEEVVGIGPFAELEFAPDPQWRLTLGGRYDRYKFKVNDRLIEDGIDDSGARSMDKFSPMLGLTYHPHHFITFYGNYSTAFQTPTTTELSNRPTGEGGLNAALRPERITGFELGLKGIWPARHFNCDLSFYMIQIADMLIPYQIQNQQSEEIFFRNAGKAENKGLEVKLAWVPAKGWRADLAYTLMNSVFKDFLVEASPDKLVQLAGNAVPGAPPHRLFAGLVYEHAAGAYAEINLQWVDQFFANDFNGPSPGSNKPVQDFINDAHLTVDLRLGFQRPFNKIGIEIFLGSNNIFNERYNGSIVPNAAGDRFFEPAAGRSWYIGARAPFSWQRAPDKVPPE
ncbi:TonB-dependent receptor [candidate division KSB1 bacterium]|nr:TonB-dependent receptor [candidate division KSB1 bacterium]